MVGGHLNPTPSVKKGPGLTEVSLFKISKVYLSRLRPRGSGLTTVGGPSKGVGSGLSVPGPTHPSFRYEGNQGWRSSQVLLETPSTKSGQEKGSRGGRNGGKFQR